MAYVMGITLFAVGILLSVCLHEAGHLGTAKAFRMKVTRYFVGFGPTLWSFRRGETEYGVKAIPAGGFVKIVGMTPLDDDVDEADQPRAFWNKPLWQRTVVLAAGSVTHFILGVVLLYLCAVWVGLPNPALATYDERAEPAVVGTVADCVPSDDQASRRGPVCGPDDPVAPARVAGLRAGDRITALGGTPTPTYGDLVKVTQSSPPGPTRVTLVRDGRTRTVTVTLVQARRTVGGTVENPVRRTVSVLGVSAAPPELPRTVTYGPVDALGETFSFTGQMFTGTFEGIRRFPEKIPKLFDALAGGSRDPETPISVVGASQIGGQALAYGGASGPTAFLLILASLNVFIGVFNLFPLLPLDGGHIAIAWFERARSSWAARRGRPDPGRVDYARLMPVTYAVILVFGAISVLTIITDVVNPITLFSRE